MTCSRFDFCFLRNTTSLGALRAIFRSSDDVESSVRWRSPLRSCLVHEVTLHMRLTSQCQINERRPAFLAVGKGHEPIRLISRNLYKVVADQVVVELKVVDRLRANS